MTNSTTADEALPALPPMDNSAAPTMDDLRAMVANLQEANRRLSRERQQRGGKGKNKQRLADADPNDLSNKMSVNRGAAAMFSNNKIPRFEPGWNKFDHGHPIRDRLMSLVQVPEDETDANYYENTVVPTFMAKMSSLKGNSVQRMRKAFKGRYLQFMILVLLLLF
jgi:hypothetical protein